VEDIKQFKTTRNQTMKYIAHLFIGTTVLVATALTMQVWADDQKDKTQNDDEDILDVGGPVVPGYARPPLKINLRPLKKIRPNGNPAGYSPAQIRQAYGFDLLPADGSGQTIAIVDAFGDRVYSNPSHRVISDYTRTDLSAFCSQFGLPQANLTIVYRGTPGVDAGWALETALDVEWAHAIAPKANLLLVVAANNGLDSLMEAVDYAVSHGASVVSMSWGAPEFQTETSYDSHFNRSGVTFVASSGDRGEGVSYPAASPYVIGVGGTTLNLIGAGWSESAWPSSGGGISQYESMPGFQIGWQTSGNTSGGWGATRGVPDVSFVADPNTGVAVYCSVYGGWVQVGGTSAGAPQWAALVALSNQGRTDGKTLGSAPGAIYSVAGSTTTPPSIDATYLIDITSGSNGGDTDDQAIAGYDLVTGLGSPKASNLAPALRSK
jgi:subtilase family serine protease